MSPAQKVTSPPSSPGPQVVRSDHGPGRKPLPNINVDELKPVLVDLIKEVLSNPTTRPGVLPATPDFPFGPSTPPLDADLLDQLLVEASDTADEADAADKTLGEGAPPADNEALRGGQSSSDTADASKSPINQADVVEDVQQSSKSAMHKGDESPQPARARASRVEVKKIREV